MSTLIRRALAFAYLAITCSLWADPTVDNVNVGRQADTNLLEVSYSLSSQEDLACTVSLEVSLDGGEWFTAEHVSGDVGRDIVEGSDKLIIWDMGQRFAQRFANVKVRVRASDGLTQDSPRVSSIEPANGEKQVNTARSVVVRFDRIVDSDTIDTDNLYLFANGQKLDTSLAVSSTQRFATLTPSETLPASATVQVVIEGDAIYGNNGLQLDADNDGVAGGSHIATFTTLPLSRIPGTNVWGRVFDSINLVPIEGVTIEVDGFPEANAISDSRGNWELVDVPVPEFFVHVDGSTATNPPAGYVYQSAGKLFQSTPGQTVRLNENGRIFDLMLPPMATSDIQELSVSQNTPITFGDAGMDTLENLFPEVDNIVWERMNVTFPAGSAQSSDGVASTTAAIIPVPRDRVPTPLPDFIGASLVISIQSEGATRFDVPAPISFPNLDGLQPGEKSVFWSYSHDAGRWIPIGTGTVSADGLTIDSDPGVGILAPGWHTAFQGAIGSGGGGSGPGDPNEPVEPCHLSRRLLASKIAQCGFGAGTLFLKTTPVIGCGISAASGALGLALDCYIDFEGQCTPGNILRTAGISILGCVPGAGGPVATGFACNDMSDARRDYNNCLNREIGLAAIRGDREEEEAAKEIEEAEEDYRSLVRAANELIKSSLDNEKFVQTDEEEIPLLENGLEEMADAMDESSDMGPEISPQEEEQLKQLPWPSQLDDEDIEEAIERFNRFTRGESDPNEFGIPELQQAAENMIREFMRVAAKQEDGPSDATLFSYYANYATIVGNNIAAAGGESIVGQILYLITNLESGLEIRGVLSNGTFEGIILAPDSPYMIQYVDTDTLDTALTFFETPASGAEFEIPLARFGPEELDSDNDGLSDLAERVLGTDPSDEDSDDDGITDGTEASSNGMDPLSDSFLPTGIVSSIPLQGTATDIHIEDLADKGLTAFVATGSHGLAIIDINDFTAPTILAQLDLSGTNQHLAFDPTTNLVALASGNVGTHFVDVSNPTLPALSQTYSGNASTVTFLDDLFYISQSNALVCYDPVSQQSLSQLPISTSPFDLDTSNNYLLAMGSGRLASVYTDGRQMAEADSLDLDQYGKFSISGDTLLAGASPGFERGGFITVDVSNPNALSLIAASSVESPNIDIGTHIVANGSGSGILIGSAGGFDSADLIDISDPTDTARFQARFNLPSVPQRVVIASGAAFIASGSDLVIVNYLGFDASGTPPSVDFADLSPLDEDTESAGIQITEGATLYPQVSASDDVQVSKIELLVNGVLVRSDVSPPWNFSIRMPALSSGVSSVDLQFRATDTGGNQTLSNIQTLLPLLDTTAPTIIRTTPSENEEIDPSIRNFRVEFDEPMDASTLVESNFILANISTPNSPVAFESFAVRSQDRHVLIKSPSLTPGSYTLTLKAASIVDFSGNALSDTDIVIPFSIAAETITFTNSVGGIWQEPSNWSLGRLPLPGEAVSLDLDAGAKVLFRGSLESPTQVSSIGGVGNLVIEAGRLEVNGTIRLDGQVVLGQSEWLDSSTWTESTELANATILPRITDGVNSGSDIDLVQTEYSASSDLTLDNLTIEGKAEMSRQNTFIRNGLTVDGDLQFVQRDVYLLGSNLLDGEGAITFIGGLFSQSLKIEMEGAETLTIGSGLTLNLDFVNLYSPEADAALINNGYIETSTDRNAIGLLGAINDAQNFTITNNGTITAKADALACTLFGLEGNAGHLVLESAVTPGRTTLMQVYSSGLTLDQELTIPPFSEFRMEGPLTIAEGISYTNEGEIHTRGNINLDTLNALLGQTGTTELEGAIELSGASFDLGANASDLTFSNFFQGFSNGTLICDDNTVSTPGTFTDITIQGSLTTSSSLIVSKTLTVDGTLTGNLRAQDDVLITGTGSLLATSFSPANSSYDPLFTIDSGLDIQLSGTTNARFLNKATATGSGTFEKAFENQSSMTLSNVEIRDFANSTLGNLTVTGNLYLDTNGGTILLSDFPDTLEVQGRIDLSDTIIDLEGQSLSIPEDLPDFLVEDAGFKNGTLNLNMTDAISVGNYDTVIFDNIVLNGDIEVRNDRYFHIINGLELNGTLTLESYGNNLGFENTQTLTGNGAIHSANTSPTTYNRNRILMLEEGGTLTLDENITISGGQLTFGEIVSSPFASKAMHLVNKGEIKANLSSTSIDIVVTDGSFTNQGTVTEENGGLVNEPSE